MRPTADPFRVLVADPPWAFGDHLPGPRRGASKNYPCLGIDDLCNFPLPPLAVDAHLFLWRVASMQVEALHLTEAWGFTVKSEIVWLKQTSHGKQWFGMGRQVRMAHETCLIATRGKGAGVRDHSIRSTFGAPAGLHSEKPEAFFHLVERLVPGPWVELFARRPRAGWVVYGNEIEGGVVDGRVA